MYLVKDYSAGFPTYLRNATLVPDEETGTLQVEYERILALNAVTARALLDKPSVLTGNQAAFLRKEAGMSVRRFLDLTLLTHWTVTRSEFGEKLPPYLDRLYRLHSGAKLGRSFYTSPLTSDDHALAIDLATFEYEWRLQVFPLTTEAGYHIAYLTNDGGHLCAHCANDNEDQCTDPLKLGSGWPVVDGFSYLELEDGFTCAHCGAEYLW